jgi:pimeloyl-ACP methyl ester carboxylesterase
VLAGLAVLVVVAALVVALAVRRTGAPTSSPAPPRTLPGQVSAPVPIDDDGVTATKYDVMTDGGATAGYAGRALVYVPDRLLDGDVAAVPVVMAAHGFEDDNATWLDKTETRPLRDALLGAGYVVVSPYYEATFGNADGQSRMRRSWQYVADLWRLSGTVLFGFSMGGGASAVALHEHTLPDVAGAFLTAPLLDWADVDQTVDSAFTERASEGLFAAYDASDHEEFVANSAAVDPMRQPASAYAGIRVLLRSSPEDEAIDETTNAQQWASLVGPAAAELVETEASGQHGSQSHFGPPDQVVAFFDRAIAAEGTATSSTPPS